MTAPPEDVAGRELLESWPATRRAGSRCSPPTSQVEPAGEHVLVPARGCRRRRPVRPSTILDALARHRSRPTTYVGAEVDDADAGGAAEAGIRCPLVVGTAGLVVHSGAPVASTTGTAPTGSSRAAVPDVVAPSRGATSTSRRRRRPSHALSLKTGKLRAWSPPGRGPRHPMTATVEPGVTCAVRIAAPTPATPQPSRHGARRAAACRRSSPGGAGSPSMCSAYLPRPTNWRTSPSSSRQARGSVVQRAGTRP